MVELAERLERTVEHQTVIDRAVTWIDEILSGTPAESGFGLNEISTGKSASWWQSNTIALNKLVSIYKKRGWEVSTDLTDRRIVLVLNRDGPRE